jgi:hypothetical protein
MVNGVAQTHATAVTAIAAAKIQKPTQLLSSREANMWLRFRSALVVKTIVTCTRMKNKKYTSTTKCSDRAC